MNELKEFSIVPKEFEKKDPRQLLYHFPSLPVVKYAKLMQVYSFNTTVKVAEELANRQGYVLLPFKCIHWQRAQKFSERRLKIGKNTFYLMQLKELTGNEKSKMIDYIEEVNQ